MDAGPHSLITDHIPVLFLGFSYKDDVVCLLLEHMPRQVYRRIGRLSHKSSKLHQTFEGKWGTVMDNKLVAINITTSFNTRSTARLGRRSEGRCDSAASAESWFPKTTIR
jgi:hypothetical protein